MIISAWIPQIQHLIDLFIRRKARHHGKQEAQLSTAQVLAVLTFLNVDPQRVILR